jgi:hypothetical protein
MREVRAKFRAYAKPPLGIPRATAIEQAVDALAPGELTPLADLLAAPAAAAAANAA